MEQKYLNAHVSLFSSKETMAPNGTIVLAEILQSDRFKPQIERLRATTDPNERKRLKLELPCFTPSGVFSSRRTDALVTPSGIISIDLDAADNKHVSPELWENLSSHFNPQEHPSVLYCGRSCSGTGWWLMLPIEQYDPALHKSYFESVANDLRQMGLIVDCKCSDIARLRFVSYDPSPYLNQNALPYRLPASFKGRSEAPVKGAGLIDDDSKAWAAFQLARYLYIIDNKELDITEGYENWLATAFGLLDVFSPERAREVFHRFSCYNPEYEHDACDRQFDNCLRSQARGGGGITVGTLLKLCREKLGALIDFQDINK